MSNDVLITPASRKIEFKDSSSNVDAKIETDSSGNLVITNPGGDISLGDTTADIFVGDGVNSIDIVFEQNGEIRGTSGVTVTLGASGSNVRMGTDLNLNSNNITNVNNLTVAGNLTVTGTTTTVESANLNVVDKNITLNYGSGDTSASANGAGITIQDAVNSSTDATILWDTSNDEFDFSHAINTAGAITAQRIIGTQTNGSSLYALELTRSGSGTTAPDIYGTNGTFVIGSSSSDEGITISGANTLLHGNLEVEGADVTVTANIIHKGDTDTYYGFHGNDLWRVVTGGLERIEVSNVGIIVNDGGANFDFRVESDNDANNLFSDGGNDRIGIGTSAPSSKLDVRGPGATLAKFVANSSSDDALVRIIGGNYNTEKDARLFLGEGDTYGMTVEYDGVANLGYLGMNDNVDPTGAYSKRIQMSRGGTEVAFMAGNVGIGTASPGSKLTVEGDIKQTTGDLLYSGGGNWDIKHLANDQNIVFYTSQSGSATEKMRIKADGNVGIGIASPPDILTITGDAKYIAHYDGARYAFKLGADSSGDGNFMLHDGVAGAVKVKLYAESGADNYINNGGNVGIGTSSPGELLEVAGDTKVTNLGVNAGPQDYLSSLSARLVVGGNAVINTNSPILYLRANGSSNDSDLRFQNGLKFTNGSAAVRAIIDSGGRFGIGTSSPSSATNVHIQNSNGAVFRVDATDGGSSPATTSIIQIYGYEGRGAGLKIRDSVNSASGASDREWFVGSGYGQSGFNIGYASDGSQSSYSAQNKLAISTSGAVTFNGAYTFPTSDGSANQVLQTDGSGNLSFADAGGGTITGVSNMANNRVLTAQGATTINAESNLTFDGSTLDVAGTFVIDTNPAGTYGVHEALRIDDTGGTADRGLQFFELCNAGARSHRLAFNTNITTTGSAYTHTQGLYGGSSALHFGNSGEMVFYVNGQVTSGSADAITPTERFRIHSDGKVKVTGSGTIGGNTPANGYLQITDGSGTLALDTNEVHTTENLFLNAEDGTIYLRGNDSGAVNLRNGSIQFMDTTRNLLNIGTISSGTITSSGSIDVNSDSGQLQFGADNDMQIFHNGAGGEINNATGNFTIDSTGDIILDADGGDIKLEDAGVRFGTISNSSTDLVIQSNAQDKDIIFKGNDGGSTITALTLDMGSNGNATFSGNVNSATVNSTGQITTGYGLSLTNGNTNFLMYNNTNDNLLYMRDTTNGQMLTTWYTNKFLVNKILDSTGDIQKGGTTIVDSSRNLVNIGTMTAAGSITSGGIITGADSNLLRRNVTSWTVPIQTVIYSGYGTNLGDYVYLKAPGNSTAAHGALIVGDNSLYYGRTSIETGGVTNSATAPLDESTGLRITKDGAIDNVGRIASKLGSVSCYSRPLLEITSGGTPTQIKITTNIPYSGTTHAHAVRISGFQYGSRNTADLQIAWHVYNNSFYNRIATSSGSWTPTITLAVENNKVVIHLASPGYWPKLYVESLYNAFGGSTHGDDWSWADAAISADSNTPNETVPYKAAFGNSLSMDMDGNWLVDSGYVRSSDGYKVSTTTIVDSSRNLTNIGTISSGAITSSSTGTFKRNYQVGENALNLLSTSNAGGVGITFSDNGTPPSAGANQRGFFSYRHADGSSYGFGNSFLFDDTENSLAVVVDGAILSKDGYYIKPSSGTGAGTQVITSARNLVNIGTISSGKLTVSTAENVVAQLTSTDANAQIFLTDTTSTSHIGTNGGQLILESDVGDTASNSDIVFKTDNATRMHIDSNGQVGIGTTSPGQKLDVAGIIRSTSTNPQVRIHTSSGSNSGYLVFGDSADDDVGQIEYNHGDNSMRFKTSASEAMRLGNNDATFYGSIVLSSGNKVIFGGDDTYNAHLQYTDNGSGDHFLSINTEHNDTITTRAKFHAGTGAITFSGNSTHEGDMNIGGTGNAAVRVRHIEGKEASNANLGGLFLNYSSTANVQIGHSGNINDLYLYGSYRVNSTVVINNSRNAFFNELSIGSTPSKNMNFASSTLNIGSVDDDDFYLNLKGFGGNSNIYLDDGDIFMYGNQNSNSEFKFTSSGTLHADGDVIAYSTTISSDRKLKENVRPIQSPMDKILHLEGVVFDWIEEGRPNDQIGFIAQEVEKIVPEVVTEVETLKTHSDTHKVVNYSAIVPILVEAVKIQQEEIERLKELAHPKCGIESFEGYADLVARIEKLENK